jgi:hypothetical protein
VKLSPRHPLLYVAYLALACRLVIPAGFMPAPLADGGPLQLCHGGPAGALFAALAATAAPSDSQHEHHHHDRDDDGGATPTEHDAWQYCPVGAVFAFAALVGEPSVDVLGLVHAFAAQPTRILVSSSRTGAYRARAPPLV